MSSKLMRIGGRIVSCLCAVVNAGSRESMGQDSRSLGRLGIEAADSPGRRSCVWINKGREENGRILYASVVCIP
jgi:hypothetical protein